MLNRKSNEVRLPNLISISVKNMCDWMHTHGWVEKIWSNVFLNFNFTFLQFVNFISGVFPALRIWISSNDSFESEKKKIWEKISPICSILKWSSGENGKRLIDDIMVVECKFCWSERRRRYAIFSNKSSLNIRNILWIFPISSQQRREYCMHKMESPMSNIYSNKIAVIIYNIAQAL